MAIIIGQGNTEVLLPTVSALTTGDAHKLVAKDKTIQYIVTGTATVQIQVSNDPLVESNPTAATWVVLYTATASGGQLDAAPWKYWRAVVSAYTSGNITVYVGM